MAKKRKAGRPPPGERGAVTTSEVIYADDETEFILAMAAYQKRTGKRFPTHSETLGVLRSLGYRKVKE